MNLLAGGVNAVATFVVIVITGRTLGASTAGEIFEVSALFSILTVVLQCGTGSGLVRAVARSTAASDRAAVTHVLVVALTPVLALSIGAGALVVVAREFIATAIAQPQVHGSVGTLLVTAGLLLPVSVVSASLLAVSRGLGSLMVYPLAENVVKPTLRLTLVLPVATVHPSPILIGFAWFAPVTVSLLFAARSVWFGIAQMGLAAMPAPPPGKRDFWAFSIRQSLADVSFVGVGWLDLVLLGAMTSSATAGVYGVVGRYLFLEEMGLVAVATVLAPEFSALFATRSLGRLRDLYRAATLWLAALAIPLIVTIAWFAALLLSVAGPSFKSGETALAILSAGIVLDNAAGPIVALLSMGGRSGSVLVAASTSLAANIGLNLLLIPPYGIIGAAVAWAASIQVINLVSLYKCWRLWRVHPVELALVRIVLGAVACFSAGCLVGRMLLGESWSGLSAATVLGLCMYAPVIYSNRHRLGPLPRPSQVAAHHFSRLGRSQ